MQRAAESCKYTGHVLHPVFKPVLDPKTKETVLNKEPVLVPSCAMVITPTCTATFAHNRTWKKGDEVDVGVWDARQLAVHVQVQVHAVHVGPGACTVTAWSGQQVAALAVCGALQFALSHESSSNE